MVQAFYDDLFSFEELIEASEHMFAMGNVTMLRDFGPTVKAGDKFMQVAILLDRSQIEFCHDAENTAATVPFKLVPAI